MPFNYIKNQPYYFCYNDLFDILSNSVFHNQTSYINAWKTVFEKLEEYEVTFASCNHKDACIFQYKFITSQSSFFIHFNIDNISNNIHKRNTLSSSISLSNFGTNEAPIIYNMEQYNNKHLTSKKPIIIVPFPLDKVANSIVIDGNHRVSAKIANNYQKIDYYLYTPTLKTDFYTELDWAMYLFYMEVYQISFMVVNGADIDALICTSCVHKNFSYLLK